jgi:tetratricopeptide (TPR) repeat protein
LVTLSEAERRIRTGRDTPENRYVRGYWRMKNRDFNGAAEDMANVLAARPDDVLAHQHYAKVCARLSRWEEIIPSATYLVDHNLADSDIHVWLAEAHARITRRFDLVAKHFYAAYAVHLGQPDLQFLATAACILANDRVRIQFLRLQPDELLSVSKIAPDRAYLLARAAIAEPGAKSVTPEYALRLAERALENGRRCWNLTTVAMAHYRAGNWDKAIEFYQQSLPDQAWKETHAWNHVGIALAQFRAGRQKEAEAAWQKAEALRLETEKQMREAAPGQVQIHLFDLLLYEILKREAEPIFSKNRSE